MAVVQLVAVMIAGAVVLGMVNRFITTSGPVKRSSMLS